jgi:predicted hydrocarbon binding protein
MLPEVSKLLLSGQLNFERGKMSIFGERILIVPIGVIHEIILQSANDKKFEKSIYEAMKKSVYDFCAEMYKKSFMQPKEMLQMLGTLAEMNGYGQFNLVNLDFDNKRAVVNMHGLPSKDLIGHKKMKGKKVADIWWAGMMAGGGSYIFGEDIECIETICAISGKEWCEFVMGRKKDIQKIKTGKTPISSK